MATVHSDNGSVRNNIPPKVGDKFLWFQSNRSLLVLTVLEVDKNIKLSWEVYLKMLGENDPKSGEVTWTKEEWNAAHFSTFVYPTTQSSLKKDEQLCDSCNGLLYCFGRDFEISSCLKCDDGVILKSKPPAVSKKRSDLHPSL